jgi:hypothetical protein
VDTLYIVVVYEDEAVYEYEYGNLDHAEEHYNLETKASIWAYRKGDYILVMSK